ncbi:MAG: hypothetical protein KC964_16950 [Candidatus Omnitrophica bacterium]|nr:hypothetical protein [Candidatus Omnitrophota bacterium]
MAVQGSSFKMNYERMLFEYEECPPINKQFLHHKESRHFAAMPASKSR